MVTHPNIAYSVGVVSQVMSSPTIAYWNILRQILCYLKGDPRCGLFYGNHRHFECFFVDRASSKVDRKSTTGYYIFVKGNPVLWRSKKQNAVYV